MSGRVLQAGIVAMLLIASSVDATAQGFVTYVVSTNRITIYGTIGDDQVSCRVTQTMATVELNGEPFIFFLAKSNPHVTVNLYDGDDIFVCEEDGIIDRWHPQCHIYGGPGDDFLFGANMADEIHGGPGRDLIWGRGGSDALYGDGGPDDIWSGGGGDWCTGASTSYIDDYEQNTLDQGGGPDDYIYYFDAVTNPDE